MQKTASDYLDLVCNSIRKRTLRQAARSELTDHIQERCAEFMAQGWDAEPAAKEAVAKMGDPIDLGKRISAANRPRSGAVSLICGIGLALVGLLFVVYSGGGSLANFFDFATFVAVTVLSSAYALLSCGGKPTTLKFLHNFSTGAIYSGVICMIIGIILMLRTLDDLAALGPGIAVAVLSVIYGCLFSAAARAAESWYTIPESGSIRNLLADSPDNLPQ